MTVKNKDPKLGSLIEILSQFVHVEEHLIILAEDFGINTSRINLDVDVFSIWGDVIKEARKKGILQEIVNDVIKRYPEKLQSLNNTDWSVYNYHEAKIDTDKISLEHETLVKRIIKWIKKERIFTAVIVSLIVGSIVGVIYFIKEKLDIQFPHYENTSICIIDNNQRALPDVTITISALNVTDKTGQDGCFCFSRFTRKSDVTFTAEKETYETHSTSVSMGSEYKFILKRK